MSITQIPITLGQVDQLQDLFNAVSEANVNGRQAAIVAQIWKDGIVAKTLYDEEVAALAAALGGTQQLSYSAADRMEKLAVIGTLRIMGQIDVAEPDEAIQTYPMALLIEFDSIEAIRKALADGRCEFVSPSTGD